MDVSVWTWVSMIGLPVLSGLLLIKAIVPGRTLPLPMAVVLSFPLGIALVSFVCMALALNGIPLDYPSIVIGLGWLQAVCAGIAMLRRRELAPAQPQPAVVMTGWQSAVFAVMGLYVLYQIYVVVFLTFVYPIGGAYDEILVFAMKAKVFFYEGSIRSLQHLFLPSYPLMGSMEMLWTAVNLGIWHETLIKSLFPVMYFCFIIFQYYFFRERCGAFWAMLAVTLTVSANFFCYHGSIGYQDLIVMVFNVSAIMLMLMHRRRGQGALLALAGVCAAFGVFVKLEGTAYLAINILLCAFLLKSMSGVAVKERIRQFVVFVLPGVIVLVFYKWWTASQGFDFGEGRLEPRHFEFIKRIPVMLDSYRNTMFFYNNWNVLWALLGCSVLAFRRTFLKDFEVRFLLTALGLSIAMCIAVDLFTHNCITLTSVLSRVFLQFFAIIPSLIVFLNFNHFERKAAA